MVFILNAGLVFNSFGFDRQPGLNRYALSPLDGRKILLGKNLAFIVLIGIQLCLLMPAAVWRLEWSSAAFGAIEAVVLALAFLAYGNWSSVSRPIKLEFYRFYSSRSPLDDISGITLTSLPGLAVIFLSYKSDSPIVWLIVPILIVCAASYFISITAGGKYFERKREIIARSL
jgi:hypothetical protein